MRFLFNIFIGLLFFTFLQSCKEENKITEKINEKTFIDSISIQQQLKLKTEILDQFKNLGCPGISVYVIKNGEDFLEICQGYKSNDNENDTINSTTMFRIGSLSKGFAGILAGILHSKSIINVNDPINKYLPDFNLKALPRKDTIRLWHILSHSTGITEHAYSNLIDDKVDKKIIVNSLSKLLSRDSTGKVYAYQNACFSLIEEVIGAATGLSYNQALDLYIFKPLKMNNTNISFDSLTCSANKAFPHKIISSNNIYGPLPIHQAYYNVASAGGINTNLEDLKKWLKSLCVPNHIITSEVKDLVFQKRVSTTNDDKYFNRWAESDSSHYGLGWRAIKLNNQEIIFHGGQVNNYRAEIGFNPKTKTGVVVMFNSYCDLSGSIVPLVFSILK
jgi:beta-lactamase class C